MVQLSDSSISLGPSQRAGSKRFLLSSLVMRLAHDVKWAMLAIGTKRTMAANHTELLGLGVGAILAISAALHAQAHEPSADTLKTEARNLAKIISGDKRKSQTYRKIVELNDQDRRKGRSHRSSEAYSEER